VPVEDATIAIAAEHGLVGAAETLAAVAASLWSRAEGRPLDPRLADAVDRLLGAVGTAPFGDLPAGQAGILAASARSALAQAAEFAAHPDRPPGWRHDDPAVLVDQGAMSAALVAVLADAVAPGLGDLAERLEQPGAAFLDVGSGVAGICLGACRRWPGVRAVALDPWPPAQEVARERVAAEGLADRVQLRTAGVESLDDRDRYELAWIAAPFIREPALAAGLPRVAAALRPGGWAVAGLYRGEGAVGEALAALRSVREGGDALAPGDVERLMDAAGLVDVHVLSPPEWLSGRFVAGRRA